MRHNRFYRLTWDEAGGRESADVALISSNTDLVLERNEFEVYRVAIWIKSTGLHTVQMILNRIVVGREPDAVPLRADDNCAVCGPGRERFFYISVGQFNLM